VLKALAPVASLLLGVAILLTGQGLQSTLLPLRANLEHFSTLSIGLMGGAYFLGFTVGCLRGVRLLQKLGHVRVFAAMAAVASAVPLLHALVLHEAAWWVLRLVTGFCFAILYVVIESWLNEQASNENRGTIFSAYTIISLTVMAVGQQLLNVYDPREMMLFALASMLVSFAALPVLMSTSEQPVQPESARIDLRRVWQLSPSALGLCLVSGMANGSFWSLAPVFTAGVSDQLELAAWFMSGAVVGGALGQWPLGRWSDRVDRRVVLAVAPALGALMGGIITWLAGGLPALAVTALGAAWGAVAFPMYAVAVAHANDYAEPGEHVMVSGGMLLAYGVGAIVGPFLASATMTVAGPASLFAFTGVVHAAAFVFVLLRIPRRAAAPVEQHIPFSDSLTATQTASQIYEEEEIAAESAATPEPGLQNPAEEPGRQP